MYNKKLVCPHCGKTEAVLQGGYGSARVWHIYIVCKECSTYSRDVVGNDANEKSLINEWKWMVVNPTLLDVRSKTGRARWIKPHIPQRDEIKPAKIVEQLLLF